MTGNLLRNWFVPKDGISREVISADIQRFLGNDATVRPGKDTINGKEVDGYWIRAYRNLTTEMINDLKVTTQKWDRERGSGRRVTNYEESHTFRSSNHGSGNGYGGLPPASPQLDGPFQPPPRSGIAAPDMPAYSDPRSIYPPHSLPPGTSAYVDPSMYASHASRQSSQPYTSQPEYYAATQPYGHEPPPQHLRSSPQYSGPQYASGPYGPPQPRDPRDDPRYQPDYQDPQMRYNYPTVTTAPNGAAPSPSQQTSYPPPMRYDQYGRPFPQPQPIADPPYRPVQAVDAPSYHTRDRPSGQLGGDTRRRRLG